MIGLGSVLFQYSGKGGGHISKFYLNDCMLKFELYRSKMQEQEHTLRLAALLVFSAEK